jgi:hypothetical protein
MTSLRTLAALSALALVTACASPGGPGASSSAKPDEHASHHPGAAPAATMPAISAAVADL